MERVSFTKPGFDCLNQSCQHNPRGEHGIHPNEWWYVVKDGDIAVSICVFSNEFPKTVKNVPDSDLFPMASLLTVHVAFPVDSVDENQDTHECEFVIGGICYGNHSYSLLARDVYKKYGAKTFEQPEEFWLTLEKVCKEKAEEFRQPTFTVYHR